MADPELSSVGDFRLGDWLVQPSLNRISRSDSTITLELKWMDVLTCLAERAGEVVTRQEIIDEVWATEFITDNTLTHTVAEIRRVLGDDAEHPAFIETIRRRGYRLVAPVERLGEEGERTGPKPEESTARPRWPHILAVGIAAIIALLVILPPQALFERRSEDRTDVRLPRIVVLPFQNLGSADDEYFADGVTEEIISRLAAVSGLRVISRTSAMSYKNRTVSLRQIGDELDVSYVLEGSIRWDRSGDGYGHVRISPQLIRVADDTHLWSHTYDQVLEDIFTIQSNIAGEVIDHLQAILLESERPSVEFRPTESFEAYQAYLLGVRYLGTTEEERFLRLGAEMLERAVELDPNFAVADALLSEAHSIIYHFRYDFTPARIEKAKAAAERAMILQPGLPEAHRALGWYYYFCFRDYDRALEEFALAAKRLPNDSNIQGGIFVVQRRRGHWNEALKALDRWQQADPMGYFATLESMLTFGMLRDFGRAEKEMKRAIAIAPDCADAYFYGIVIYLKWDESTVRARRLLESAPSLDSPKMKYLALQLDLYDRKPERALARIEEFSSDPINLDDWYRPKSLLECICLSQMNEWERAEAACSSAVELLEREIDSRPYDFRLHNAIGHAFALLGRKDEAVAAGERAVELVPISSDVIAGSDQAIELAKIYAQVGETGKALDLIEELLENPGGSYVGPFRIDPVWDPLRELPRFQDLLEKYEVER